LTQSEPSLASGGSTQPSSAFSQQKQPAHHHHGDALLAWWLAAAIVGADIGTSVFYTTGVILPLVGFAAPFHYFDRLLAHVGFQSHL
jgi:hypothetical protein